MDQVDMVEIQGGPLAARWDITRMGWPAPTCVVICWPLPAPN